MHHEFDRAVADLLVLRGIEALARELDQAADATVRAMNEVVSAPAALAVYRRDQDVPPWTGLPTAGCHRALVRRVVGRRPDAQLVTYNRSAYRRWLGSRPDSEELRTAWAIELPRVREVSTEGRDQSPAGSRD